MGDFSLDIRNALLGGGNVLEQCHEKYSQGDRSVIMTALIYCSLMQELIPDWVADELLTLDTKIADNKIHDMNEFFNFQPKHKAILGVDKNLTKNEEVVLNALFNHRLSGGSFNSESGIRPLATELGLSSRLVNKVYLKNKEWLKSLPRNREEGSGYMHGKLPTLLELAKYKRDKK